MKQIFNFFCLLFLTVQVSFGQGTSNFIEGDLLVQIDKEANIEQIAMQLNREAGHRTNIVVGKHVSVNAHIWQLQFDPTNISHEAMLQLARRHNQIHLAQNNHILKLRATTPNDTEFASQWQYINTGANGGVAGADIDADLAWDITTGGITALGDTIVVAIIDGGFDLGHSDFEDNLWVNYEEIPNNGIDDDMNGYIDDIYGWDAQNNNGGIGDGGWHGTPVAGIIGAKGNNNNGVAGVNWNVKLMIIQGGAPEMLAIASYDYALTMRKRYNISGGQSGAFVVATNSSWGIDMGQPSDAPLWCAFYDTLGVHGILSCGATANANFDIDAVGDLPTGCASDYMIAVTNLDNTDTKVTSAGYGTTTIDLGAFGEGTYTCALNNSYGGFGGTSGATPHVTGAIALIYSIPCPSLIATAKSDPGLASLMIKDYILNGVDPNASLAGITVTGGRLNLHNSLLLALDSCDTNVCYPPFSVVFSNVTVNQATIGWDALGGSQSFNIRYRETGTSTWTTATTSTMSYAMTGLTDCTQYEVQLESDCPSQSSGFGSSIFVSTDGCCTSPSGITTNLISNGAEISWDEVTAAVSYNIQYRPNSSGLWTEETGLTNSPFTITGLEPCSEYEVQLQTVCTGQTIPYDHSAFFETECGACTALPYCETTGNSSSEWIASVEVGSNINTSAGSTDGYVEYTSLGFSLEAGQTYPITLVPSFSGSTYDEYFLVWIDFNQDGDFEESDELVFDPMASTTTGISGMITVPSIAASGHTRMRVAMSWDIPPVLCQTSIEFGEVEDYCVNITPFTSIANLPSSVSGFVTFPNPFSREINVELSLTEAQSVSYELIDIAGHQLLAGDWGTLFSGISNQQITMNHDLATGMYFLKIITPNGIFVRKLIGE